MVQSLDVQVDQLDPTPLPLTASWISHSYSPKAPATRRDRACIWVALQYSFNVGKNFIGQVFIDQVNSLASMNGIFILSFNVA